MPFPQGHALLIGVGTHQSAPQLDVPVTVADAEAVANLLQSANHCGYPSTQVKLVTRVGATKAGILAAFDDLAQRTTTNDTAFFFYCGHGALGRDGNYYLVSHDAQVQNGRVVAGTGVSEAELLQKLRAIRAERALLIFNACHSGNISPTLAVESGPLTVSNPAGDTTAALLGTGKGRLIITACREEQVSYIGDGKLTLFTQALVDGLTGKGVRNSNGYISAFSLYEYLFETVSELVSSTYHAVQEPELTVLRGVGPFAVALYRGASTLGDFAGDEPLPEGMAVRTVTPQQSERRLQQRITIHTGGGTYVAGNVNIKDGDFIGRDKIVYGDDIRGNKTGGVQIGNVTGGIHRAVIAGGNASQVNLGGQSTADAPDPMPAIPALQTLRTMLSALYETEPDIRRMAQDAGLDVRQIDFSGKAVNTWHQLLAEAHKQGKVKAVIGNATLEYPAQAEELRKTYQVYTAHQ